MEGSLAQLKNFLNELFQFESQDLDFGIYKILHYKHKEIKDFIERLLTDKVKQELTVFDKEQKEILEIQFAEIKTDATVKMYLEAKEKNNKSVVEFILQNAESKAVIDKYESINRQLSAAERDEQTENRIYNHLYLFFSRYYDKGDFISKRRYGKSDKYVIPYNGEETNFYWANQDQYYIKSSEYFQHFSFKVPAFENGTLNVHFKLSEVQTEQGNVKADENKYFVLSQKAPSRESADLSIWFEFRALSEEEKKQYSGNSKQDVINESAVAKIKAELAKDTETNSLWQEDEEGKNMLLKKLNHYTKKNSYDFFIHKNLKAFFERELDYYIKTELVLVEDLYVLDSEQHFENIKHNFKLIKCYKNIADTIIAFLAQIEDFQKKLWEKKKFVLSTNWVITIDKLMKWVDETKGFEILNIVLQNDSQLNEWKKLFGEDILPTWKRLGIKNLKTTGDNYLPLPIDTIYFKNDFKYILLATLSAAIDLDIELDGTVMNTDNYHGLKILEDKFRDQIQCIYIDPPYNTSASEIIYKNSYKHSSWGSFMNDRIAVANSLLKSDGIGCYAIDDFELDNLNKILENIYGDDNHLATVPVRSNPHGRAVPSGFSPNHEYALFYSKTADAVVGRIPRNEDKLKRYPDKDDYGIYTWINFRGTGANTTRIARPKLFYPVYVKTNGDLEIVEMVWDGNSWAPKTPPDNAIPVYPIDGDGTERVWTLGWERAQSVMQTDLTAKRSGKEWQIQRKYRPNQEGALPGTWWDSPKYSATESGTKILQDLFASSNDFFSYPKSIHLVVDCLRVQASQKNAINLDYFPGSGTTFHATQILNKEDSGNRKCILTEQGRYVFTVVLPRIKKVAFSYDWKNGLPEKNNGLGIFLKYQKLEQYEEALENIAFAKDEKLEQQTLGYDEYIPKYFLELETRQSRTLVNTEAMQDPWDYKLKVWNGYDYDTELAVDLFETFNYLIGLHMHKCYQQEHNGIKYLIISGKHNDGRESLVVWRNIKGWDTERYDKDRLVIEELRKGKQYDNLYVNGQCTVPGAMLTEDVFVNQMIP